MRIVRWSNLAPNWSSKKLEDAQQLADDQWDFLHTLTGNPQGSLSSDAELEKLFCMTFYTVPENMQEILELISSLITHENAEVAYACADFWHKRLKIHLEAAAEIPKYSEIDRIAAEKRTLLIDDLDARSDYLEKMQYLLGETIPQPSEPTAPMRKKPRPAKIERPPDQGKIVVLVPVEPVRLLRYKACDTQFDQCARINTVLKQLTGSEVVNETTIIQYLSKEWQDVLSNIENHDTDIATIMQSYHDIPEHNPLKKLLEQTYKKSYIDHLILISWFCRENKQFAYLFSQDVLVNQDVFRIVVQQTLAALLYQDQSCLNVSTPSHHFSSSTTGTIVDGFCFSSVPQSWIDSNPDGTRIIIGADINQDNGTKRYQESRSAGMTTHFDLHSNVWPLGPGEVVSRETTKNYDYCPILLKPGEDTTKKISEMLNEIIRLTKTQKTKIQIILLLGWDSDQDDHSFPEPHTTDASPLTHRLNNANFTQIYSTLAELNQLSHVTVQCNLEGGYDADVMNKQASMLNSILIMPTPAPADDASNGFFSSPNHDHPETQETVAAESPSKSGPALTLSHA